MLVDISDLALNDRVYCKQYGFGHVIECTETPTVKVKFDGRYRPVTFNSEKAAKNQLEIE